MSTLRTLIRQIVNNTDEIDPRKIVPMVIGNMTPEQVDEFLAEALVDPVRLALRDRRRQGIAALLRKPNARSRKRERIAEMGQSWKDQGVWVEGEYKHNRDLTCSDMDWIVTNLRQQASDLNHRAEFYAKVRDVMERNGYETVAEIPDEDLAA